jgi:hypothetical protein
MRSDTLETTIRTYLLLVFLLDMVSGAVNIHNRIDVRLERFLGCNKVLNVAILSHFGVQEGCFVAITQLERVPSTDALTVPNVY